MIDALKQKDDSEVLTLKKDLLAILTEDEIKGEQPMAVVVKELDRKEEEAHGEFDNENNNDITWIIMNGIQEALI